MRAEACSLGLRAPWVLVRAAVVLNPLTCYRALQQHIQGWALGPWEGHTSFEVLAAQQQAKWAPTVRPGAALRELTSQ